MNQPSYDNRNGDQLYQLIKRLLNDNPNLGRDELPRLTGAGERACRNRKKWYIREQNEGMIPAGDVIRYLSKARTEAQLRHSYGETWESIVKRRLPGYNLFEDRNDYNDRIFILHPEMLDEIKIENKEWKFVIGRDIHGIQDPCMTVQFPESCFNDDKLIIAPLYDVHLGHHAHREEKFLSYISWIHDTENVFSVLGGDLLENALDDGRGMTYDSSNPESQIDEAIKKLAPIAHKILVAIPGNHEWRTYKKAGLDPTKIICDKLKIPYFSGPVFMRILGASRYWNFYIAHGRGNSQTKGGKLNAAQRLHNFIGLIHFNISGHVHDPIVNPETVIVYDAENCCLKYITRWTVIAPSFLGWKETYAYRAGYAPPGKGGVSCHLFRDGSYKATMT